MCWRAAGQDWEKQLLHQQSSSKYLPASGRRGRPALQCVASPCRVHPGPGAKGGQNLAPYPIPGGLPPAKAVYVGTKNLSPIPDPWSCRHQDPLLSCGHSHPQALRWEGGGAVAGLGGPGASPASAERGVGVALVEHTWVLGICTYGKSWVFKALGFHCSRAAGPSGAGPELAQHRGERPTKKQIFRKGC